MSFSRAKKASKCSLKIQSMFCKKAEILQMDFTVFDQEKTKVFQIKPTAATRHSRGSKREMLKLLGYPFVRIFQLLVIEIGNILQGELTQ